MTSPFTQAFQRLPVQRGYTFNPASAAWPINPRDLGSDGVTRTLMHRGATIARSQGSGASYCCGVTFEVWFEVAKELRLLQDVSAAELESAVQLWFCPTTGHPGVVTALEFLGLGRRISLAEARPGDFIQYWRSRSPPSGHSAIFERLDGRRITYLSSQRATCGVGRHVEEVGEDWEVHAARAFIECPILRRRPPFRTQ